MSDEVLVKVEGVSKKFCRSLKRSLWYGVQDVSAEMFGRKGSHDELRKNEFWAVDDVSFELKRGECLGLIGPNGAGKSTLLKMLNGLVKPDKGRITMRGRVGALIELGAGFNPILTGRENIYVNGSVLGFTKKEIDRKFDAIVDFAEIEEFIDTPVQNYSSGMKVRLGFAIAAQMEPDILIIDEVLAVGDAAFKAKCLTRLGTLFDSTAIILVSHSMPMISRMASVCLLLDRGRITALTTDVGDAIGQYHLRTPAPLPSRFETEVLTLEEFSATSIDGIPQKNSISIRYGDSLEFKLRFSSNSPLPPFVVNLSFFDVDSHCVAQCLSTNTAAVFHPTEKRFEATMEFAETLLNPGKYYLQLAIVESHSPSRRGQILYLNRNECILEIKGESLGFAPVQLKGIWEIVR